MIYYEMHESTLGISLNNFLLTFLPSKIFCNLTGLLMEAHLELSSHLILPHFQHHRPQKFENALCTVNNIKWRNMKIDISLR